MAQATQAVKGRQALLQKVVFEVRYRFGFSYLDNCGRTANQIMQELPEWILRSEGVNPQNAPLVSIRNSCLFNFSALKYDLSIERPAGGDLLSHEDAGQFADQAESLHLIIQTNLGLKDFTRIGFRAWYIFPSDTEADTEKWLLSLGVYNISESMQSAFGGALESSSIAVVLADSDRKYRIAFNGVATAAQVDLGQGILTINPHSLSEKQDEFLREQQKVKKRIRQNPEFAAMIDIDAYQEGPRLVEPKDFIMSSLGNMLPKLNQAVK